ATAADIFTLGILLYELISGRHPFRGKGRLPHEVMRAICEEDPPPPSAVAQVGGRQIRGELDAIVMTALRKEPAWRYPSVEQLADDIDRYRRGWPVMARGNTLPYRARKFVRRQWLPLAATAALIAALSGGVLVARRQAGLASAARLQAEAARSQAERERAVADQARVVAEEQRRAAEAAQKSASEQREVAEARRVEAENERRKEHHRYQEVRSLASSLLFDVYDSVRDLAGSATARRLMVRKAQHQLEILQADSGNDPDLQRDLAASYERLGELRADPRRPDKSDAAVAVSDYEHGVALRRNIAARAGAGAADRRDLALSLAKLGDGEFTAGNTREALAAYEEARNLARQLPASSEDGQAGTRALGIADERLCAARLAGGNTRQAIDSCREGLAVLKPLSEALPEDLKIQNVIAVTEASYANALRLTGKPREAVPHAQAALVSLRRLQTLAPSNAEYR